MLENVALYNPQFGMELNHYPKCVPYHHHLFGHPVYHPNHALPILP
jgi:hypothetical protein